MTFTYGRLFSKFYKSPKISIPISLCSYFVPVKGSVVYLGNFGLILFCLLLNNPKAHFRRMRSSYTDMFSAQ